jgi:hypothetical protein
MKQLVFATMFAWAAFHASAWADDGHTTTVIVVRGAPGSEEYAKQFATWAERWKAAAGRGRAKFVEIGAAAVDAESSKVATAGGSPTAVAAATPDDRTLLREAIEQAASEKELLAGTWPGDLWLVLIGHGTFDGKKAKFNLRGADVTADDLAEWLKPVTARTAIVNCASSSGPFINRLSGANRVIVTATKSGYEQNFARFGDYLSAAIGDDGIDLDKDEQTSLLEAYLAASARTEEFYKQESRLATEHALVDDNGDGLGTPADWFKGWRSVRAAKAGAAPDGSLAAQLVLAHRGHGKSFNAVALSRCAAIERQIAQLRNEKAKLDEREYFARLEAMLIELAETYDEAAEEDVTEKGDTEKAGVPN